MIPPFDIFRIESDGSLRWLEPASNLDTARTRLQTIGPSLPGTYLIFSQITNHKISIDIDADGVLTDRSDD